MSGSATVVVVVGSVVVVVVAKVVVVVVSWDVVGIDVAVVLMVPTVDDGTGSVAAMHDTRAAESKSRQIRR